jgi:hypothetical protein
MILIVSFYVAYSITDLCFFSKPYPNNTMQDQHLQDILNKHNQEKQAMLQEIIVTEQNINVQQNKLKQLAEVNIPKNASLFDLLALSDLLDTI